LSNPQLIYPLYFI